MLMWAGNSIVGRLAIDEISPMALVCLRWCVVSVFFVLFARRYLIADWPVIRRNVPYLLAMGAAGYTGFSAFLYLAAHHTSGVNMTILQGSIPILTLIGAALLLGTPIRKLQIAGVASTLLGVAVIATGGRLETLDRLSFNIGDGLLLIGCTLYAGYTLALRKRPDISRYGFFTAIVAGAFVSSLPLVGMEAMTGGLFMPTPKGWLILLFVAIFPSFLAQLFFMRGVELIGPARASLFSNLVPAFGSILAVLVLDETFETFHAVALLLVIGGILISEWSQRR